MLFHKCDKKNINLLSFACQNCFQKTLSYGDKLIAGKVWANEHALLPKNFWKIVLFSDGTTMELHPNKRVLVRRVPNTGIEKKNLTEKRKFGGKKLML